MTRVAAPGLQLDVEGPDMDTLEGRASAVLKVLAVISIAGAVLALFPGLIPSSALLTLSFNVAALALAALYLATARGLDRRRTWAIAAIRPLLVLVAAVGAYTVAAAFANGVYRIPFETLLAAWALRGAADQTPLPGMERHAAGLLLAVGWCMAVMAFGDRVFGWGGALDVRPADLRAALVVDCGPSTSGLPDGITVAYEWSWARTSPLPNETDMIVIGWTGDDPEGRPLYTVDDLPEPPAGIDRARTGELSRAMVEAARGTSDANFQWAIDLAARGLAPGRVEMLLGRARPDASAGSVVFRATYVHLGVWMLEPEPVTCAW